MTNELRTLLITMNPQYHQLSSLYYLYTQKHIGRTTDGLFAMSIVQIIFTIFFIASLVLYYHSQNKLFTELHTHRNHLSELVSEKTGELQHRLEERDLLIREIHHRVKNNLSMLESMIHLTISSTQNIEVKQVLKEITGRIETVNLIHNYLYRSDDLGQINFLEYTKSLIDNLVRSFSGHEIKTAYNVENSTQSFDIKLLLPLGLIMVELCTNALKYGAGSGGSIIVSLRQEGENFILSFYNSGKPIDPNFDFGSKRTLGTRLIKSLVHQLSGTVELQRKGGTTFIIIFPDPKAK